MKLANPSDRRIIIGSLSFDFEATSLLPRADFLALVPAYSLSESVSALQVSKGLIELGCKEFCCVGPYAEKLHDEIDMVVEDQDRSDIITTSFIDDVEACEYFLWGADAGESSVLLGLISEHPTLEKILLQLKGADVSQSKSL